MYEIDVVGGVHVALIQLNGVNADIVVLDGPAISTGVPTTVRLEETAPSMGMVNSRSPPV